MKKYDEVKMPRFDVYAKHRDGAYFVMVRNGRTSYALYASNCSDRISQLRDNMEERVANAQSPVSLYLKWYKEAKRKNILKGEM